MRTKSSPLAFCAPVIFTTVPGKRNHLYSWPLPGAGRAIVTRSVSSTVEPGAPSVT